MRSVAPCGRFPRFIPFPNPLRDTFPPATCARSRFAAITTWICRQIDIHLPPNPCQFGGELPPFPHGVSAVPARPPHRSRTTPRRLSHKRNNLSFLAEEMRRLASPVRTTKTTGTTGTTETTETTETTGTTGITETAGTTGTHGITETTSPAAPDPGCPGCLGCPLRAEPGRSALRHASTPPAAGADFAYS